uniref:excalibur calcium-binding domain-containing protein n=1 Tax=Paenibacillus sp. FSL H8-0168 TaxID=2921378 RepID=UPI00406D1E70
MNMWLIWIPLILFSVVLFIGSIVGYRNTRYERFPNYITPTIMLLLSLSIIYLFAVRDESGTNTTDNVYYQNCDEVRSAGEDPLYSDEPGYRPALDRDNDGVACER